MLAAGLPCTGRGSRRRFDPERVKAWLIEHGFIESPAEPGRPTKYSQEVADLVIASLRQGNYLKIAAAAAGICYDTLREWMRRSEAGDPEFSGFSASVRLAEKEGEMALVGIIADAAKNDPKHAKWLLERRHPKRWGRRRAITIDGRLDLGSSPPSTKQDAVSRLKELLSKARAEKPHA